jgi:hypothetical protein
MSSDPLEPENRRGAERHRTLIAGRVYYRSGQSSLDCQVRNISLTGACLKGRGVTDLPDHFRLEIPARDRIYECEARWRSQDMIGVQFKVSEKGTERAQATMAEQIAMLEYENRQLRQRIKELSERLAEFGASTASF